MFTSKKFFSLLITLILIITTFSGCSSSDSNAVIYYEATSAVETLDPQIASNDTELLMIRNLFEGLFRINKKGEVVPGIVTDYEFSDNIYTFELSETSLWSDGTPVTAHDFVFAMQRAVDPETRSPYSGKLSSILNAEMIISGQVDKQYLGVTATNSTTLQITLAYDDPEFLYKLTTSVFMPCNEDFFNSCNGQYGLSKDYILTNGSYKLTKWNNQDFAVRMHRSDKYFGKFPAQNSAVFISHTTDTTNLEKLKKSSVDIAYISMGELNEASSSGLKSAQFQNVVWVMEMSDIYSYDLRRALYLSFDRKNYAGDLGIGYNVAYSFYPASITNQNLDYVGIENYDINEARTLYNTALKKYTGERLPSTKLYYYNNPQMTLPLNDIIGHWQKQLGAYINTKPVDNLDDLKYSLANNECAIAVYPITITDKDPAVLSYNLGYTHANIGAASLSDIQTLILSEMKLMPIAFENTVIAYSKDITEFNFNIGNGCIDFAYITKQ